ncbi:hypothetical protein OPT61_g7777 [Boeremia exigua]|uniref:Uncharacterized protein n=1 Tax=Boeremia exigua TaxID=749465 RepID=A0ACC2I0V7_9PLEO|nr:hypothetical protein OPT61_g7777 [Boeremia exigua]
MGLESLKLKTEQNEELVQRLETVNDQISSDASEIAQLREEADSLRKTVDSLEQTAKQNTDQHTSALDDVQKELAEAKKKADSFKADLETAKDRHRQDLRVLGEDHDAEIDSLRADLEGDAKKRFDQLQAKYDSLVDEKNAALKGHEKSLADRAKELEEAHTEISTLKASSGSTSQGLDEALAKHKQVLEEKTALAEAHYTAQKQVADLEARLEALTKENALIADLQARIDAMTEDKQAADSALADSEKSLTDLKAELDALTEEKQSIADERARSEQELNTVRHELEASVQDKQTLEDKCTKLEETVTDLKAENVSLGEANSAMEDAHAHTIDALKHDSESATKQILSELQSKYDNLLEEKSDAAALHAKELEDSQAKYDTVAKRLANAEDKLEEATAKEKATEQAHAEALDKALDSQHQDIEQKYMALLEEVQADYAKLEQDTDRALAEKQSALDKADALSTELDAQIKHLEHELAQKEDLDSAGLIEVTKKYETLLLEQSATDREAHEAAMEELGSSLKNEYEVAQQEVYTELESLRAELAAKEKADSAGLAEVTKKYESLLAEQSAADKRDHEATLALYRNSADTDLNEAKERYEALIAEKDSLQHEFGRAKNEANAEINELRRELKLSEQTLATAAAEASQKYDALVTEKTAAAKAHEDALSSLRQQLKNEREHAIAELQSQNQALQEKFTSMDEEHQQTLVQLRKELEADHVSDADALRQQLEHLQKEHAGATKRLIKAHEDAISELVVSMENSTADAVQQLQKKHDALEAQLTAERASHDSEMDVIQRDIAEQQTLNSDLQARYDNAVAELETFSEDTKRLQETIEAIEAERDGAYKAAMEAEDRIETFKGEVVRKHLAHVEPLRKENVALLDKIDRLKDMLSAGDRIARAAATVGEKREMTPLTEQSEEEQDSSASAGSGVVASNTPRKAPLLNGAAKDVVGTLAAMQETLTQLSALNDNAFVESQRTAQRLTERD